MFERRLVVRLGYAWQRRGVPFIPMRLKVRRTGALLGEVAKSEKCIVCGAPIESETDDYCNQHLAALQKLREAFPEWSRAYEGIRPKEFLSQLSKLTETGDRIKEVAAFLSTNPDRWPD